MLPEGDATGLGNGPTPVAPAPTMTKVMSAARFCSSGSRSARSKGGAEEFAPHGPIVEMLLERGFAVFAINPKQLNRFRDRFTVAGAKDDRRDAHVLGDSLRTDRRFAYGGAWFDFGPVVAAIVGS